MCNLLYISYISVKLLFEKQPERKVKVIHKGVEVGNVADLSVVAIEARRQLNSILRVLERGKPPVNLYFYIQ